MFTAKKQNATFQINVDATMAIQKMARSNATIARLLGLSHESTSKEPKKWSDRDKQILHDAMLKCYLSITYLDSDSVFFVRSDNTSYVAMNRNKAVLFSEVLGRSTKEHDENTRVEFRVYSRLVNNVWCLTTALLEGSNEQASRELHVLADWPMFEIEDGVYESFGFKVDRSTAMMPITDEFGESQHSSSLSYTKNGVEYSDSSY